MVNAKLLDLSRRQAAVQTFVEMHRLTEALCVQHGTCSIAGGSFRQFPALFLDDLGYSPFRKPKFVKFDGTLR